MLNFKYNNCEKCGCKLIEETRYIKYINKGKASQKIASSRFCITHKIETDRTHRNKSYHKNKPLLKNIKKYCLVKKCGVLLTKENSKIMPYTTKAGISKTVSANKCIDCINAKARKVLKEKIIKKNKTKKEEIKKNKTKKIIVLKNETKKLTTKEKMQISFDEEANRRLRTIAKGINAVMVNPIYQGVE